MPRTYPNAEYLEDSDLCYIDHSNLVNRCMRARKAIKCGQEILSEKALFECDVGLVETYNDSIFFDPNSLTSGIGALVGQVEQLDPETRRIISELYHGEREGDSAQERRRPNLPLSIQLNAFNFPESSRCILRVYQWVSRVNHSCRPNAMFDHCTDTNKGTLRALRDIDVEENITIDYCTSAEDCLRSRDLRRAELSRQYRFICECTACSLRGHRLGTDTQNRNRALTDYMAMTGDHPGTRNEVRVLRLQAANSCAQRLIGLGLRDLKVAQAYKQAAMLHHQGYEDALTYHPDGDHCDDCTRDGHARAHLESALKSLGEGH